MAQIRWSYFFIGLAAINFVTALGFLGLDDNGAQATACMALAVASYALARQEYEYEYDDDE